MSNWLLDVQGYREILDQNGDPLTRRNILSFQGSGATVSDNGSATVVAGLQGATGATGATGPSLGTILYYSAVTGPTSNTVKFLVPGPSTTTDVQTAETRNRPMVPRAGVLQHFRVKAYLSTSTDAMTATVRVNGVDTPLTVTIPAATAGAVDSTHTVNVNAGDEVSVSVAMASSVTGPNGIIAAIEFA